MRLVLFRELDEIRGAAMVLLGMYVDVDLVDVPI